MVLQQQISFKQAAIPSLGLVVLGCAIWYFNEVSLSLLGAVGFWSIPLGVVCGTLIYALTYYLSRYFLFNASSFKTSLFNVSGLRELFDRLHVIFANLSWPGIIILSCSAGVGEELLIRGLLQTWLVSHFGVWAGVILASLIFGVMHAMTKLYVLITFLLGLVFGVIYVISDSIVLVMIAHTVYDIFAFAVIVKYPHLLAMSNESNAA